MTVPDFSLSEWTPDLLQQVIMAAMAERDRRQLVANAQAEVTQINAQVIAAEGIKPGDEWRQPTAAHDAYPKDWEVASGGRAWVSLIDGNVWEPGVTGWREIVAEGYPAWVQPLGAHDAYAKGAKVSDGGKNWTSIQDGNVWKPGVYGWEQIDA